MFALLRNYWNELRFRIDPVNLDTRSEQLRTRLNTYLLLVGSQMAIQPFVVWLMWDQASHRELVLWLMGMYVLHTWEVAKWFLDRAKVDSLEDCRQWSRHFVSMALVIGLMWGAVTMFFFPADFNARVLLICVSLGLAAGAVTMNAVHPPSQLSYVLAVMVPLIFRVAVENDVAHWGLAYMLMLFLLVMLVAGYELNKLIHVALSQRFENQAMAEHLARQKMIADQARAETEAANALLRDKEKLLESLVQQRTAELLAKAKEVTSIQDVMIMAMCSLAETRDNETGNHIKRTQNYVRTLARQLRDHPRFRDFLTDENIDILFKVAPLHDIGKVGIPDAILLKPGRLTAEEFEVMKTHTTLGGNAIMSSEANFKVQDNHFIKIAREIAMGHHEKWDGSGYPAAQKGDEIPIPARLMALADVYDALISARVYKEGYSQERVEEMIVEGRGKHFDPDVVEAFLAVRPKFIQIAEEFKD